jgi:SAM (Sterile alpha motif) domain-containing protein
MIARGAERPGTRSPVPPILRSWTRPTLRRYSPRTSRPEKTVMDVASWLRNLGLERYEIAFRENDVGADVLRELITEDLEALGVVAVGHIRRLLAAG